MTMLVAEFPSVATIESGAERARGAGFPLLDALTPFPIPALMELTGRTPAGVRVPMALAGFGVAIAAYAFEYWTAVHAYPFNIGGRPLHSWPVFLLVPFEVGVLAAAVAGMVVFLFRCGFPRLNHSFFEVPGSPRATQDRFFLIVDTIADERRPVVRTLLFQAGAISVSEAGL